MSFVKIASINEPVYVRLARNVRAFEDGYFPQYLLFCVRPSGGIQRIMQQELNAREVPALDAENEFGPNVYVWRVDKPKIQTSRSS